MTDTGIGIAPEYHDAVFDDFSQVDSPVQKRLRGTGLGLSLSKQPGRSAGRPGRVRKATRQGLDVLGDPSGAGLAQPSARTRSEAVADAT